MKNRLCKIAALWEYAGILAAFVMIGFHCVMTARHGVNFINSDQSAELMLGKLLAKSHRLLAKDWYYSTELRVFSMNLIYAGAWLLAKTYTGVMVLSQAVSLSLLYGAQVYFYKKLGSRHAFWYPLILLVPFSCEYFIIVIFGLHYIPHIVVTFFTLGMLLQVMKTAAQEGEIPMRTKVIFVICALLGVLEGMGGMRMLIVLYVPLAGAAVFYLLLKEKTWKITDWQRQTYAVLLFALVNAIAACLGYAFNVVILRPRYHFESWGELLFNEVKVSVLWRAIADWVRLFGFEGGSVFRFEGLASMGAVLLVSAIVYLLIKAFRRWREWSGAQQMILLFAVFANLCIVAIFVFSDLYYESRYYIPALVCLWPVIFMMLEAGQVRDSFFAMAKPLICAGIVAVSVALGVNTYHIKCQSVEIRQEQSVVDFLLEEGYTYGFATFWHANVMNQLSEDALTVCPIENLSRMNRYRWLTSEEILYPDWDGAVFLVIEDIEHEIYQSDSAPLLDTDRIVYARDGRWVYCFASYEEFANYLSE